MKNLLSVVIYTYNEELNIEECIRSAKLLSDEVIVIDMESKDKTVDIAKKNRTQIVSFPYRQYVEPAREFGIKTAKTNWVFILDADERIDSANVEEIQQAIKEFDYSYYYIPRKNIFARKKWLRHGGWWPDFQIRLINTKAFVTWPKEIHSTPVIKGSYGFFKNPLLHYFHGDFEKMVEKTIIFENIESDMLYRAKKNVTTITFFRKFFGEIWRRLIKNLGFFDGTIGIIESVYQAFSKTITYIFLYEKVKKSADLRSIS